MGNSADVAGVFGLARNAKRLFHSAFVVGNPMRTQYCSISSRTSSVSMCMCTCKNQPACSMYVCVDASLGSQYGPWASDSHYILAAFAVAFCVLSWWCVVGVFGAGSGMSAWAFPQGPGIVPY